MQPAVETADSLLLERETRDYRRKPGTEDWDVVRSWLVLQGLLPLLGSSFGPGPEAWDLVLRHLVVEVCLEDTVGVRGIPFGGHGLDLFWDGFLI